MGYTHYWRRTVARPDGAYPALVADTERIIAAVEDLGISICGPSGDHDPVLASWEIAFNGTSTNDRWHESFRWPSDPVDKLRTEVLIRTMEGDTTDDPYVGSLCDEMDRLMRGGRDFSSCKTARKSYDLAVCAVLIRAKVHYGDAVWISSDGTWEGEWCAGYQADSNSVHPSARDLCLDLFGEADNPLEGDL